MIEGPMRTYSTPRLHHLGQMADVTRKTGPLRDGDPGEPGQVVSNYPPFLVALCSPSGALYGSGFCLFFGFPGP